MVGVKGVFGRDTEYGPAETFKQFVTFFIAFLDFGPVINATINLDDKSCARDGKIHNYAIDRVLAADGKTVIAQGAQSLPGDVLRNVG